MNAIIQPVTDTCFDAEVLESSLPVLVDYWAEWCGPCRMMEPLLAEVAESYAGRLRVAKMNVDENQAIHAKYGVRGVPTLMLFNEGQVVATKVGAMSRSQLVDFLETSL